MASTATSAAYRDAPSRPSAAQERALSAARAPERARTAAPTAARQSAIVNASAPGCETSAATTLTRTTIPIEYVRNVGNERGRSRAALRRRFRNEALHDQGDRREDCGEISGRCEAFGRVTRKRRRKDQRNETRSDREANGAPERPRGGRSRQCSEGSIGQSSGIQASTTMISSAINEIAPDIK